MKIRLKVLTPAGEATLHELAGPAVTVGRDPACELALDGEAGSAVSRRHARIEEVGGVARLTDLGSANGTLHNDRLVNPGRPPAVQPGDRVQLGYTGPTLLVLAVDLAPAPAGGQGRARWRLPVAVCGVAAVALLVGAVVLWPRGEAGPAGEPDGQQLGATAAPPRPAGVPGPGDALAGSGPHPSLEVKAVGHYLRPASVRPSVLLQRAGEGSPWTVLRSGQAVTTAHSLLSLPGYESLLALSAGVHLTLWGSLPEFDGGSHLLESSVLLGAAAAGDDVDLTLDRGRVELRPAGTARRYRVRLRFQREAWGLTLEGPDSAACVELTRHTELTGPVARLALYTRGPVTVRRGRTERVFTSPTLVRWASATPEKWEEDRLTAVPAWWDNPPAGSEQVRDALLSLGDWARERLDQPEEVVDSVLKVVREPQGDLTSRLIGVWFLAALDEAGQLLELLDDAGASAAIRTTAMLGLQDWLARAPTSRPALVRLIRQRRGYSDQSAALIAALLSSHPEKAVESAAAYQGLIGHLEHDVLAVRHMASYRLYVELAAWSPPEAAGIDYDAVAGLPARKSAAEKWRKAVPSDRAPRKRPPQPK